MFPLGTAQYNLNLLSANTFQINVGRGLAPAETDKL